ncbi:small nuclear ribonucleoprotein-associated protein B, putative [Hepatocystis sp. ex Piliocolobus tephrosceles]|uniref:Sm protein B n=1 Tax=Piliocolobus tephrosceles TaxID=591936 RepID=A0A8C9GLQ8_9PRIM|nr:small nuclear ribonucleoprotein-associated protein B, putative [Hepatocystis sp. ex Piliocolobus tephrosceles]
MGKNSRLENWLQYRVRVTISDTRYFVGTFLSYDRHMNIVLVDAEEFRKVKSVEESFKEIKRVVGLILIRGENIVSFTAERAPISKKSTVNVVNKGVATGRGIPLGTYMPMQGGFNPNMPGPIGTMPTGMAISAATMKTLTPVANPNFKPQNMPLAPNFGNTNVGPQPKGGMVPPMMTQLPFPPNIKPPTE